MCSNSLFFLIELSEDIFIMIDIFFYKYTIKHKMNNGFVIIINT